MLEPLSPLPTASHTAGQFEQLWSMGREVDLEQFASGFPNLSVTQLVELIRIDQREHWRRGESPAAENYLLRFPSVADDDDLAIDVIYHEFLLREEHTGALEFESFLSRFPQHASILEQQIRLHLAILEVASGSTLDFAEMHDDTFEDFLPDIPGYDVEGLIAAGGMSLVYDARHLGLDRHVAIKMLLESPLTPKSRQLFDREARTIAKLDHENVVRVFDVGVLAGRPFLVLEYVSGGTLSDHYRGYPLPHHDVAKFVAILTRAIQYCHDRGIVHRDLKPGNILLAPRDADHFLEVSDRQPPPLDRWIPKVTDFGLSKLQEAQASESPTRTGTILGTPSYMAPEQARGEIVQRPELADVYALGAILYELLCGRPPYQGATPIDVLRQVIDESPLPLNRLTSGLPRSLETICLKCLEKEPSRRYASAAALANDLDRFLSGDVILARRASPVYHAWRWTRRNPVYFTLTTALIVLTIMGGIGYALHHQALRQNHANELIASLRTADTGRVLEAIQSLSTTPGEAVNALRNAAVPVLDSPAWWHLRFAQVYFGLHDQQLLVQLVPRANPAELELLAHLPGGLTAESEKLLWQNALNESLDLSSRLHCAAALGSSDAHDPRWSEVATPIAQALLRQPLTDLVYLTRMLAPQRESLRPSLEAIVVSSKSQDAERHVAVSVLAEYFANEPTMIVDWMIHSDPQIYSILLAKLKPSDAVAIEKLEAVLQQVSPTPPLDSVKKNSPEVLKFLLQSIALARQRAAAAITLAYLGEGELLTQLLAATSDPTARTHAIELSANFGLPMNWFVETIARTTDENVCRSAVLALGQYEPEVTKPSQLETLRMEIGRAQSRFPRSPGLTAAVLWLDRKMSFDPPLAILHRANTDFGKAMTEKIWRNSLGQCFVAIAPSECLLGSPIWEEEHEGDERQHLYHVPRAFAISEREITVAEIQTWRSDYPINPHYSNRPDDAVGNISFFAAASFCRWLSEREGIEEDQI